MARNPTPGGGEWRFTGVEHGLIAKVRVGWLAGRQFGVVARRQLLTLGISDEEIRWWIATGYLYWRLPGVYAVGHVPSAPESRLSAALLWAGPGAMLSHASGVWWLGLTDRQPGRIHLSTPRRPGSRHAIEVHDRSSAARTWHHGLPVAPVSELLLQYATVADADDLRYALSQAQYHGHLDLDQVGAACGHGRRGSTKLKRALARHLPQLAVTRSRFERRLLHLCERHRLELPVCNIHLNGFLVDAVWPDHKLIVELDGKDGHLGWDRIRTDHHRDLVHRAAGFSTLRYIWEQFERHGRLVAADIARALRTS